MFLIVPGHQPMSSASLGSSTLVGKHFMILSVRLVPGLTVLSTEAVRMSAGSIFEYDNNMIQVMTVAVQEGRG